MSRAVRERAGGAVAACLALLALVAAPPPAPPRREPCSATARAANGAKRLKYRIGPFKIIPGQNEIGYAPIAREAAGRRLDHAHPARPDLHDGKVPGVDVIHLHHGVWVNLSRPGRHLARSARALLRGRRGEDDLAASRRATATATGHRTRWLLNHMIHNLTPVPTEVYMVYEIDFIPDDVARRRGDQAGAADLDGRRERQRLSGLQRREGRRAGGTATPTRTTSRTPTRGAAARTSGSSDRDGVLVATARPPAPGRPAHRPLAAAHAARGSARRAAASARDGRGPQSAAGARRRAAAATSAHLFRSKAKYFEPAGAVSWDVAMTATRPDWRVKFKQGDVLSTTATYGTRRAAWWESMGIMVAYMADGGPGRDPFKRRVDFPGRPTHGHLPENNNHGGRYRQPARPAQAAGRHDRRRAARHPQLQLHRSAT